MDKISRNITVHVNVVFLLFWFDKIEWPITGIKSYETVNVKQLTFSYVLTISSRMNDGWRFYGVSSNYGPFEIFSRLNPLICDVKSVKKYIIWMHCQLWLTDLFSELYFLKPLEQVFWNLLNNSSKKRGWNWSMDKIKQDS